MSAQVLSRREAYAEVKPKRGARHIAILELLIRYRQGLTAHELSAILHEEGVTATDERNTTAPRLTELTAYGWVEADGRRLNKSTNRRCTVYAITKQGIAEYVKFVRKGWTTGSYEEEP